MPSHDRHRFNVSGSPAPSRFSFSLRRAKNELDITPICQGRNPIYVTNGRSALALALKDSKLEPNEKVLIPCYHCLSMVLPITWIGAKPLFYKVNEDMSPNIADLQEKLKSKPCVLVIVHYFGFPQDLTLLSHIADEHGVTLIEDCAHAFFGTHKGRTLGSYGDYTICSPWKFLPVVDGGALLIKSEETSRIFLRNGGLIFQIKVLVNQMESILGSGKNSILKKFFAMPFWLKDLVWEALKKGKFFKASSSAPASIGGSAEFEPDWVNVKMSIISRFIACVVDNRRIVKKRRENYLRMLNAFLGVRGCRPIHEVLPDGVVPYVFPLYVEDAERVFHILRSSGISVLRWEDIPSGICEVSTDYQCHLLQLPLHQEIGTEEFEWVIETVVNTINRSLSS